MHPHRPMRRPRVTALALPVLLLLPAGCVAPVAPAQPEAATPAATPAISAPAVDDSLRLTDALTVELTGPISPGSSIVGPVGEPQMHDAMTGTTGMDQSGMDHSAHMAASSAPFDLAFLDDMIAHHQGAIDMATQLLENTDRPELIALANGIVATQGAEVAEMQDWREEWYPGAAASGGTGMPMGDMAVSDDAATPFEQRFLLAMIAHHEGAVGMAQMALEQAEHPELRERAAAIIAAQETEINQMQKWLGEWFGM